MNNIDMKELRSLFEELMLIVEKYGDSTIINQKRILASILDIIESNSIDYDKNFIDIQRQYEKLYPARGGLSEFFIWKDDFQESKAINEPLSKIRNRLWEIFK